jgi:hypothetical protein
VIYLEAPFLIERWGFVSFGQDAPSTDFVFISVFWPELRYHLRIGTRAKIVIFYEITTHDSLVFDSLYHHLIVIDHPTFFRY